MTPDPEVRCTLGHPTQWPDGREQLPCGCVRQTATAEALVAALLLEWSPNEIRRILGMAPAPHDGLLYRLPLPECLLGS